MVPGDPIPLLLKTGKESLDNIFEYFIECPNEDAKYEALFTIMGTLDLGQVFIFVDTKSVHSLYERLNKDGFSACRITGDLTVEERTSMAKRIRDGGHRMVISTILVGIDTNGVTAVIAYDLPIDSSTEKVDFLTYLHRIGQTGRLGRPGFAFNFVDSPATLEMIKELEQRFHKRIDKFDRDEMERERECWSWIKTTFM